MSDHIIIRSAVESDLQEILEIYNDAILNTTSVYNYKPHTLPMRRQWFAEKMDKDLPIVVAEIEYKISGFATYGTFRNGAAYKYTVENSVYVKSEERGKGIGKKLLAALIDRARHSKVHVMVAGINADNDISIGLHKSFGFVEAGHIRHAGYKFSRWLDLKLYELILDSTFEPVET